MTVAADDFWACVALLTIGTLAIRGSMIAVSKRVKISDRQRELFTFIPAAILPALVAPMVFFHQGHVEWLGGKERFVILLASTAVCYLTRSMIATVGFGLVCLYGVSHL